MSIPKASPAIPLPAPAPRDLALRPGWGLRPALAAITLALSLLLQPAAAQERPGNDLGSFFPLNVGDLWTYELADGGAWARTVSSQEPGPGGRVAYRVDESSQDYRLVLLEDDGLSLVSLHFAGGVDIEYENPVLLVPVDLSVGSTHRVEASYAVEERGVPSHQGKQIFEIERLADRSVDTPAGRFDDCLVLRIRSRRESETGAVAESVHHETRTPGLGLVRLERESTTPDQAAWVATLDGASIRGRLLTP